MKQLPKSNKSFEDYIVELSQEMEDSQENGK